MTQQWTALGNRVDSLVSPDMEREMAKRIDGSIDQLPSGKYRIRYRAEGKRHTKTLPSRSLAEIALRQIQTDIDRGEYFDEAKGNLLFAELTEQYLKVREPDVSVGTFRNWKSLLATTLLPNFGTKRLRDIGTYDVEAWWSEQAARPVNRRNAYFLLSSMLKRAMKWGYIRSTPCLIDKAGKDVAKPRPTFKVEDFKGVLEHIPDEMHVFFWTLFTGSLRLGEVVGLNRGDFDETTGMLTVERQVTDRGGAKLVPTKTGANKSIPLYGDGLVLLTNHVKVNLATSRAPLFTVNGQRITRGYIQRAWEAARAEAGLPEFHLHDLRHVSLTFWSQLPGMNVKDIQERGGHATVTSALRYQHKDNERALEFARMAERVAR